MKYKSINIEWLGQSGFRIKTSKAVVYIDPFKLNAEEYELDKADIIFITHSHYDHCSIEDIQKVSQHGTIIVCPPDVQSKFRHIDFRVQLQIAEPGNQAFFEKFGVKYWGVPAYCINKNFHSKEEDWLGYIIQFEGIDKVLIYHAGDTDLIPEMKDIEEIDIALLPVGGVYTMNAGEAAKAAAIIKPKLAIPMHYDFASSSGTKIGSKMDAELFAKNCAAVDVEVKILEKSV